MFVHICVYSTIVQWNSKANKKEQQQQEEGNPTKKCIKKTTKFIFSRTCMSRNKNEIIKAKKAKSE